LGTPSAQSALKKEKQVKKKWKGICPVLFLEGENSEKKQKRRVVGFGETGGKETRIGGGGTTGCWGRPPQRVILGPQGEKKGGKKKNKGGGSFCVVDGKDIFTDKDKRTSKKNSSLGSFWGTPAKKIWRAPA